MATRDAKPLEAKGLAIVTVLVVVSVVMRYWHQIPWSAH
jgi:hypothetical protein